MFCTRVRTEFIAVAKNLFPDLNQKVDVFPWLIDKGLDSLNMTKIRYKFPKKEKKIRGNIPKLMFFQYLLLRKRAIPNLMYYKKTIA